MSRQSPSLNIGRRRSLRLNSPSEKGISITLENKENYCSPDLQANLDLKIRRTATTAKTPLTPVQNNLVHNLRQRLEQQLSEKMERSAPVSETRTSPGLTKLRMTPGEKYDEIWLKYPYLVFRFFPSLRIFLKTFKSIFKR